MKMILLVVTFLGTTQLMSMNKNWHDLPTQKIEKVRDAIGGWPTMLNIAVIEREGQKLNESKSYTVAFTCQKSFSHLTPIEGRWPLWNATQIEQKKQAAAEWLINNAQPNNNLEINNNDIVYWSHNYKGNSEGPQYAIDITL